MMVPIDISSFLNIQCNARRVDLYRSQSMSTYLAFFIDWSFAKVIVRVSS